MSITHEAEIGGRIFSMEAGKLAEQADGAVIVRYGDSVVLATAVAAKEPREGADFFPLTVDYEERMYAAGKIPGGFIKRESRPSEAAILAMRLTDRPLRPLFPKGYYNDVQVVLTVLSTDQENDPDILALNGASAALSISHIPFMGPVGAVRVGRIDGEFVSNPTNSQLAESELDLVVAGTREAVMMVEAGAKILPETVMADAIAYGHAELQKSIDLQERLVASAGTPKKAPFIGPKASSVVQLGKLLSSGMSEFVVFDLETTSMKPENGYIVDIAALRVRDGQVVDRFESLVNPGRAIVGHQVHGISTDDVANAPDGRRGAHQLHPVGRRHPGRGPQHQLRPAVRAPPSAERRPLGRRRACSTRSSWATSCIPMLGPGSSPSWCASSSAGTMPRRTAPCRTRRRPPSSSSTSPRAWPSGSTPSAATSPTRYVARATATTGRSRASGWRTSGAATASARRSWTP